MILLSIDVGTVNMACCMYDSAAGQIMFWEVLRVAKRDLCLGVRDLFRDVCDRIPLERLDRVVVEMQPGRSQKMKSVQHFTHMYFVCRDKPVTIYSARHKLKNTGLENSGRDNYRARKKAAIHLTRAWLEERPQAAAFHALFDGSSKKDDL